jgi:hypothetical protein
MSMRALETDPGAELAQPQLFPIDAGTVLSTFDMFYRDTQGEKLTVLQDSNVRAFSEDSPKGFLLHLRARPELVTDDEKLIRAYRAGIIVGGFVVGTRVNLLGRQGQTLPGIPSAVTDADYSPKIRPQLRVAKDSSSSSISGNQEVRDFRRFLEPEAAVILNSGLRAIWKLRGLDFTDHADANSYVSLGVRDTFTLFDGLYRAAARRTTLTPRIRHSVYSISTARSRAATRNNLSN